MWEGSVLYGAGIWSITEGVRAVWSSKQGCHSLYLVLEKGRALYHCLEGCHKAWEMLETLLESSIKERTFQRIFHSHLWSYPCTCAELYTKVIAELLTVKSFLWILVGGTDFATLEAQLLTLYCKPRRHSFCSPYRHYIADYCRPLLEYIHLN